MSGDEALLRRNLNVLRHLDAPAAVDVEAAGDHDGVIEPAKSGDLTWRIRGEDGTEVHLHSRYDPRKEAERWAEQLDPQPLECYVLIGLGLGWHLRALADVAGSESLILAVARSPEALRATLSHTDLTDLMESGRIRLVPGPDAFVRTAKPVAAVALAEKLTLLELESECRAFPKFRSRAAETAREFVTSGTLTVKTALSLPRRNFRNRAANLPDYVTWPGIRRFRDCFSGRPGFLVSSGPSLHRNVHELKRIGDRGVMIAVSSALQPVTGAGVRPHFTCVLDYHRISARYFQEVPGAEDFPLIADPKASDAAIGAWGGPKVFFNDDNLNLLLGPGTEDRGSLESATTVAHTAFFLLHWMGCDPIVFVGQDLGYPDNITHAPGAQHHSQWAGEVNRFHTLEMKEWDTIARMRNRLHRVEDVHGGTIWADENMATYLSEFNLLVERSDRRFIDATEGGARIRGTEVRPLADVVDEFCTEEIPLDDLRVPPPDPEVEVERLEHLAERLDETLRGLRTLDTLYRRTIDRLEEVERLHERGRNADPVVLKVRKLRKQIGRHAALVRVVSDLAKADEMAMAEADRRIAAEGLEGRERQRAQAARDRNYVEGLRNAGEFLRDCLEPVRDDVAERLAALRAGAGEGA